MAIKKVLQDKRYKNRELQIMRVLDHANVVRLKNCFFSTTEKDEVYLNLVLEYVSETVNRVTRHYTRMSQQVPILYVRLYAYQVKFESMLLILLFLFISIPSVRRNRFSFKFSSSSSSSCARFWFWLTYNLCCFLFVDLPCS